MVVVVEKRDKTLEDFDSGKVRKVVKAAGLTDEEADKLTKDVETWLENSGKTKVTSVQIRDKVVVEIQKLNEGVARKFISYEMYRDKHYGRKI